MSMNLYTVGDLKEYIKDLPDNMLVVTMHGEPDHWIDEGMFDGPTPYVTDRLWEVRTGFRPSTEQPCMAGKVLVLCDLDQENVEEWWNEHVEDKGVPSLKVDEI